MKTAAAAAAHARGLCVDGLTGYNEMEYPEVADWLEGHADIIAGGEIEEPCQLVVELDLYAQAPEDAFRAGLALGRLRPDTVNEIQGSMAHVRLSLWWD